jgi:hypothetical protein
MRTLAACVLAYACWICAPIQAAVAVSDPSTSWIIMAGNYDFASDQQTGHASSDIVGVDENYGFFVTFNDFGSASDTDGQLGFRLRLDAAGGNKKNPAFRHVAWIGIDANMDESIDAFLGVNQSGNASEILISAPGGGNNKSPRSTSFAKNPHKSYGLNADNYNYRPVDYLTDGGTTNDVTPDTSGDPDYYLSFMVPFSDVVGFLNGRGISITDQSPLRYVVATSTQPNSLNQDIGGVDGGIDSAASWAAIGGYSEVISASGILDSTLVPEPAGGLLVLLGGTALALVRRRDR